MEPTYSAAVPGDDSHALYVTTVSAHVASGWTSVSETNYILEQAQHYFREFSMDTLHRIESLTTGQMNLLMDGLISHEWDEDRVNDYISIADVVERRYIYSQELNSHLDSFKHYELVPIVAGEPYPSERGKQCKAVFEAAIILHARQADDVDLDTDGIYVDLGDGELVPYIRDEGLRNLLVKSNRRAEAIQVLRERYTTDPAVILEVMNHEVPVLSSGLL